MALYSLGQRSTSNTFAETKWDMSCSTGVRPKLVELGHFAVDAGGVSVFVFMRSATLGTRTTPVALIAEDSSSSALAGIDLVDCAVAWSVQPTYGAVGLRRTAHQSAVGIGTVLTFPRGITIANSSSLLMINSITSRSQDIYAVADI